MSRIELDVIHLKRVEATGEVIGGVIGWVFTKGLVVVMVGARAAVPVFGAVVGERVVVSRHPPNQPYFTHEVVGKMDVDVDELVELVVEVSSRHPAKVSYRLRA